MSQVFKNESRVELGISETACLDTSVGCIQKKQEGHNILATRRFTSQVVSENNKISNFDLKE